MSRARRLSLWVFVSLVMLGSVLVYVEALTAINGRAPAATRPSGWVAVLQPATEPGSPHIGAAGNVLLTATTGPGGPGCEVRR